MVTKVSWIATASGDWATAANWSGGAVPDSADAVVIATPTVQTITHDSGNDVVDSIDVGQDHFQLNGGSLEILTTGIFNDTYTQTGGTLVAGIIKIAGSGTLVGGSATGKTMLNIGGPIALANYTLAGSAQLNNVKVTSQTGEITVGDATGVGARINNAATGSYDIAGDFGIAGGASSAAFINAGTLAKTNGSGTSTVGIDITNTGTIAVAAGGTLEFDGPNNVVGGTITGAGGLAFGGGGSTTLTVGTLAIASLGVLDAASVTLGTNTALTGSLIVAASNGNATLQLGAHTLTVDGDSSGVSSSFGEAFITGTGTLANAGTFTLGNFTLGGSVTLNNTGTIDQVQGWTQGDGSGKATAIVNAAGATYDFTQDVGIGLGADTGATFTNSGLVEKTQSDGTSTISSLFANAAKASVQITTGTISFANALSNAGLIGGSGTAALINGCTATFSAGTTLSVAQFVLTNSASLSLATSLSYAGVFVDAAAGGNTTLNLGSNTLTLTGKADSFSGSFGAPTLTGSGTLVSAGTLSLANLTLGGTVTFDNTGTADQVNTVTLGDGSGNAASIVNAASGIYDFTQDTSLNIGADTGAIFSNSGTLEKTQSNGSSTIAPVVVNGAKASILANSGEINFSNALQNAGTIGGAGVVALINSCAATFSAGTTLSVAELVLTNSAALTLGTSLSYGGIFVDASNGGDTTLNLTSNNLTLTGASNAFSGSFGEATLTGVGTLTNTGSLSIGELTLGDTVSLLNTGTVNQAGGLTLGDGSGKSVVVDNAAKATWNLVNSNGIGNGASSVSAFENFGTLNASPGSGNTVTIDTTLTNETTGTLAMGNGALNIEGTFVNEGTISGPELNLVAGASTTLDAGTVLKTPTILLTNSATLTLGTGITYTGAFVDAAAGGNTVVDLTNHKLILTGPASFTASFGGPFIYGPGLLELAGATQLGQLTLGTTASVENLGTIEATGTLQIGDGSGDTATFTNTAKGIYDLVNNGAINVGASLASSFINQGLFEQTQGTGTTVISSDFVNTGTITVTSGTLEFRAGTLDNMGTINGVVSTDNQGNVFITHT